MIALPPRGDTLSWNSDSDSVSESLGHRGTSSKDYFSSYLHLSRGRGCGVQQPGSSRGLLVEAESPPKSEIIGRGLEVRVVEGIESFYSPKTTEQSAAATARAPLRFPRRPAGP